MNLADQRRARGTTTTGNPPVITLTKAPKKPAFRSIPTKREEQKWMAKRDALPFYCTKRNAPHRWWTVEPTANFADDMETGRKYARQFLEHLFINAGPAMLAWIVSDMAAASKSQKGQRHIDNIAVGFMHEIATMLQAGIINLAIGRMSISDPTTEMARAYCKRFDAGNILKIAPTASLDRHPSGSILARSPAGSA
jgi:hypothetical protein